VRKFKARMKTFFLWLLVILFFNGIGWFLASRLQ